MNCIAGYYCTGGTAPATLCTAAVGSACLSGATTAAGSSCPLGMYCTGNSAAAVGEGFVWDAGCCGRGWGVGVRRVTLCCTRPCACARSMQYRWVLVCGRRKHGDSEYVSSGQLRDGRGYVHWR